MRATRITPLWSSADISVLGVSIDTSSSHSFEIPGTGWSPAISSFGLRIQTTQTRESMSVTITRPAAFPSMIGYSVVVQGAIVFIL
jgi:hypothetical protein